jgi:hypothetical protein
MSKPQTTARTAVVSAPSVPRAREICEGMHGDDVVAVKRALSRAGYLPWGKFTPVWDAGAIAAVQPFQADHGVPPGPGTYGPLTHAALTGAHAKGSDAAWAYDAHAIALMEQFAARLAAGPSGVRGAVLAEAVRLFANRNEIDYVEVRPVQLGKPPVIPGHLDCSSFVTFCYFVAGADDPNGLGYTGYGNTTNLVAHGTSCSQGELEAGDLVFYGSTPAASATDGLPAGSPTHVALYDGDGQVFSQGGPKRQDRMSRHPVDYRPITHCRHFDLGS